MATTTQRYMYRQYKLWQNVVLETETGVYLCLFIYFLAKGPKQTLHVSRYMDVPLKMNSNNLSWSSHIFQLKLPIKLSSMIRNNL